MREAVFRTGSGRCAPPVRLSGAARGAQEEAAAGYYSGLMQTSLFRLRAFLVRIARRFKEENFDQTSASLAFTTLLSVVPLVALIASLVTMLPVFPGLVEQVDQALVRNLLPERSAGAIIKYILRFSDRAADASMFGLFFLVGTAFLLLLTIERVFNRIWKVSAPRPLWLRLRLYAFAVAVWPLVLGIVVAAISYAVSTSLGFLDEAPGFRRLLMKAGGFGILTLFLSGLYYAVPYTRVRLRDAAWAGFLAALGFSLMQKAFELYLSHFPSYRAIYGAFAALPIFLIWLYLSWAMVLLGALVAAALPEFRATSSDAAAQDVLSD